MEKYKYSHNAGGKVKHINHNDGITTICGLELEYMYSSMIYDRSINLPICKKCEKILKIVR